MPVFLMMMAQAQAVGSEPILISGAVIGAGGFLVWQARTLMDVRDSQRDMHHEMIAYAKDAAATAKTVETHEERIGTVEWHIKECMVRYPVAGEQTDAS